MLWALIQCFVVAPSLFGNVQFIEACTPHAAEQIAQAAWLQEQGYVGELDDLEVVFMHEAHALTGDVCASINPYKGVIGVWPPPRDFRALFCQPALPHELVHVNDLRDDGKINASVCPNIDDPEECARYIAFIWHQEWLEEAQ